jgi:hypothetical protein
MEFYWSQIVIAPIGKTVLHVVVVLLLLLIIIAAAAAVAVIVCAMFTLHSVTSDFSPTDPVSAVELSRAIQHVEQSTCVDADKFRLLLSRDVLYICSLTNFYY